MTVKVTGPHSLLLLFSRVLLLLGIVALLVSAYFPGFEMHQEMRSQERPQRQAEADHGFRPWGYGKTQTTTIINQTGLADADNDTNLAPVKSETSLEYTHSSLKWLAYALTALLVFSVFAAVAVTVLEIRYDPKRPGRTKITMALFYPLIFMVVALALLFFFIVPQYCASEIASAANFRPQMPTPAIGSGSGPYAESGAGSDFDRLFPPDESDTFQYSIYWAPGMALYLYLGAAILFMASYFFLRGHVRTSVGGAKDGAVALEKDEAEVMAAVEAGSEEEPVEVAVSELADEEEGSESVNEEDGSETVVAAVEEEDTEPGPVHDTPPHHARRHAPKPQIPAVTEHAPLQGQAAGPAFVKTDDIPSKPVTFIPAPSQPLPQGTARPDNGAADMPGLDLNAGSGSEFDLRMGGEAPPPVKVTIIEMGERDFQRQGDLDIEGEQWLTLECPDCGSVFKVSSHDRTVKCDRCGLESEIG